MQVGFIGLGAMGRPMAAVLAGAGYAVQAFDQDAGVRQGLAELDGIEAMASAAETAAAAEVLFTCLPNDEIVRQVYLGDAGVAAAIRPGSLTVDCSTVGPGVTQEIAARLKAQEVDHLDASMLGSVPQAESGEIGFVVGGAPAAYERAGPLLDVLGRFRKYAGPSGSANRIKLIHQSLVAINAAAVAEAVALCLATDTDLDCFYDVVCGGGGFAYSRYFEKRVPRMRGGDFSPLFMLDLMTKDAGLAQDLAREAAQATPLLDQAVALYREGQDKGWGREDFSAIAHLYEQRLGRSFADEDGAA